MNNALVRTSTPRPAVAAWRHHRRVLPVLACLLALQGLPSAAWAGGVAATALPTGGQIVAGQGSMAQSQNSLTVQQNSNRLITNWQSFNVGSQATVLFQQPSASAVALNRVQSADPSQIQGQIQANGQIFILNPSGVVFGPSSRVDAGGIVASTLSMTDADFMNGTTRLQANGSTGTVLNQGRLTAKEGGFVALVGGTVNNTGTIDAPGGQVALAAGSSARLDLTPSGLVSIQVDGSAPGARIDNSGVVTADGGQVYLTARQAGPVLGLAINQTGTLRANTLTSRNGEIWLDGGAGETVVAGTVEAKGNEAGQPGGHIVATGDQLTVTGQVNASGVAGGGLINLGGGWQGKDPAIVEARQTNITPTARVTADALTAGDGGTVVAWSSESTRMDGTISAKGAGQQGRGGQVETSSRGSLGVNGLVNVAAPSGQGGNWLLDPNDITVSTGVDSNVTASPNFTASGSPAVVSKTSIENALNASAGSTTVTLSASGNITISTDISKTAGGNASLVFDAVGDISLAAGKAISSISGKLNVDFGTTTHTLGTTTLAGPVSTNGGNVNFYKNTSLAFATPVSTKVLDAVAGTSGNITFYQDVTLAAVGLSVAVSAQGAQSGASYVGNGGDIVFKGNIISGQAVGLGTVWPQALTIDTTGVTSGAITLGTNGRSNAVGTIASPLAGLTLAGPTSITLNASEINLRATSGDVLTASSNNGVPKLVLVAPDTAIRVTGGTINGITGYADYRQETFDIAVSDATPRTLTISSDRSIKIKNRTIDGVTNAGASKLAITLDPFTAAPAVGGAVVLDTATLKSNGGDIVVGGKAASASDYAVGYGGDLEGITEGIRIFNSNLSSAGGNIYLSGAAPTTSAGGAGVLVYGTSTLDAAGGNLLVNGLVTAASTAGNKDAVVIGEGSNSRTTLITSGAGLLTIVGDASGVVNATSGSRYDGIIVSSNALLKTAAGNITLTGKGGSGLSDSYISDQNHGIKLETNGTSIVSTQGDITLAGKSGGKIGSYGIYANGNLIYLGQEPGGAAYSGVVTLMADTMQVVNTSTSRLEVQSTGELRIRPWTAATNISFGTAGGADKLYLGSSWFSGNNAVFQPGFEDIIVGWSDLAGASGVGVNLAGANTTGTLSVDMPTTVRDSLNLRMNGTGGKAAFNAPLTVQGASGEARILALDLNAGATGSGAITVDQLQLMGSGAIALSGNSLINTLSASTTDKITLNNAQTLIVGTVTSHRLRTFLAPTTADVTTTGIVTSNDDVTLTTSSGDLTVTQNITVGSGVASLKATAGKVVESGLANPIITANKLAVSAGDTSSLANNNVVGILAARTTGAGHDLTFVGTAGIQIDSVTDGGGTVLSGLSVTGNAFLTAQNGNVTQNAAVTAGAGGLYLNVTNGSVTLTNTQNTIATLAATLATNGKTVDVYDLNSLTVGTVGTFNGISTNNGTVTLKASADVASTIGDLTVLQPIATGTGSVTLTSGKSAVNVGTAGVSSDIITTTGSGNVLLGAAGGLSLKQRIYTQAGTVRLTSGGIGSMDVGTESATGDIITTANSAVTLNAAGTGGLSLKQHIVTATATPSASGTVSLTSSGTLDIGTQSAANEIITTNGGAVTANAVGALGVQRSINAGAATVSLTAGGAMNVGTEGVAYDIITTTSGHAVTLNATGTGGLNLKQRILTAAGTVNLTSGGALNIGTVSAANDIITTNGGAVTATATGDLGVKRSINAGAATVSLTAGGAMSVGTEGVNYDVITTTSGHAVTLNATGTGGLNLQQRILTAAGIVNLASGNGTTVGALNIGTVSAANDIITTNGGAVTATATGDLGVKRSINAGAATVSLTAGGAMNVGTQGLTRDIITTVDHDVTLKTTGTGDLGLQQHIGSGAGAVSLTAGGSLNVGTDNAAGGDIITTSSGNITLEAAGNMSLQRAIWTDSGTVQLTTDSGSKHLAGSLGKMDLGTDSTGTGDLITTTTGGSGGSVTLNAYGDLSLQRRIFTNAGTVGLTSGGVMQIGTISAANDVITTNGGAVTANAVGALGVKRSINAGAATVSLTAGGAMNVGTEGVAYDIITTTSGRAVTLNATGTGGLNLQQRILTAAGTVHLTSGSATAVGAMNIGTVSAATDVITTNGGAVTATATGDLGVKRSINAGAATVSLTAGGIMNVGTQGLTRDIITTVGGDVTLKTTATGDLGLQQHIGAGAGAVTLTAGGSMNVGTDNAAGGDMITTSSGNITLAATGNMSLQRAIVTNAGTVQLTADTGKMDAGTDLAGTGDLITTTTGGSGGSVTLTAHGALNVQRRILTNAGAVGLSSGGAMKIGTVSATDEIITTTRGAVTAGATGDLSTLRPINAGSGAVILTATGGALTLGGTVTTSDTATLTATNDLTLNQPLHAGPLALLTSTSGAVNEGSSGLVTATALYVTAVNSSSLATTTNDVGTLAATVASVGAPFTFADRNDLTIGTVNGHNGIATNNGNITLRASADTTSTAGTLSITQPVNAGSGLMILSAGQGAVNESGAGLLTAGSLNVAAATGANLSASNTVGTLSSPGTLSATVSGTGAFALTTVDGLTIGTVNGVDGITTQGGDVTVSSLDIAVAKSVTTGGVSSGVVTLHATTGGVNTASGATVTAKALAVQAINDSLLLNSNNVGSVAAQVTNGKFGYQDIDTLAVDTVSTLPGVTGSGEIYLGTTAGQLALNQSVSGQGMVSLNGAGGILQSGGQVTAPSLRLEAAGPVSLLSTTNNTANLAAHVTGGTLAYRNATGFTVTSLTGTFGNGVLTTTGLTTGNGELYANAQTGDIILAQDVRSGTALTTLEANSGGVTQNSGRIAASGLRLRTGGAVSLPMLTNDVATLAGTVGGAFTYRDASDLSMGTLTGTLGGGTLTTTGLSAGGAIWTRVAGNLTLNAPVHSSNSGSLAVVLAADKRFYNRAGSTAITTAGQWLIYDDNPKFINDREGLTPDFIILQHTYDAMLPTRVRTMTSGNGYITTTVPDDPEQFTRQSGGAASQAQPSGLTTATLSGAQTAPVGTPVIPTPALIQSTAAGPFTTPVANLAAGQTTGTTLRVTVESDNFFESHLGDVLGDGVGLEAAQANGHPLPTWMSWDPVRKTITGEMPQGVNEPVLVRVTAQDGKSGQQRATEIRFEPAPPRAAPKENSDEAD
ncbi:MAG: filamentous hemagglutinin N-terminal domain-containing protein [Magnetococcales bacterium]|nr:filamentous hemagglutinin N-terminal domain-containing protein [Magnetococcales bacterium]